MVYLIRLVLPAGVYMLGKISFYFIESSEFNAYQMRVKLVFFYSEKISYFFTSD